MKINSHIAHYRHSCEKLGIRYGLYAPFNRGMWIITKNDNRVFFYKSMTPLVRSSARIVSHNKIWANQFLSETKVINVPEQTIVKNIEALKVIYSQWKKIVVKPFNGMGGNGITVLPKESELAQSFTFAQNISKTVIVERYIPGDNYRFLVLGNKVLSVIHRKPPMIIADGITTLANQIEDRNLVLSQKKIPRITLSSETLRVLASQGHTPQSIPSAGTRVTLRLTANLSKGAITEDVTDTVSEETKQIAIIATKTLNLDIAGIDIITEDLSDLAKIFVIEANAAPGLKMHYFEENGERKDVATDIMKEVWGRF